MIKIIFQVKTENGISEKKQLMVEEYPNPKLQDRAFQFASAVLKDAIKDIVESLKITHRVHS